MAGQSAQLFVRRIPRSGAHGVPHPSRHQRRSRGRWGRILAASAPREIFSYVLEGRLEHKDSMGNQRTLEPGQVQLMSAGRGVTHSEYNPSPTKPTRFLQIWIQPDRKGLEPSYTEWQPKPADADAPKVLVISPDGRDDSATIHQDAFVYRIRMNAGEHVEHELVKGRGLWLQIMTGAAEFDGMALAEGDGASTESAAIHTFRATADIEALLFDLR